MISSLSVIATWLECFTEMQSWCRNEQVCPGRKSVKLFERSNGLDTARYIKRTFPCLHLTLGQLICIMFRVFRLKCSVSDTDLSLGYLTLFDGFPRKCL